jgi:zinc transport system substrate-binding protein
MIDTKSQILRKKYPVLAIAIALVAVVGTACASDTNSTPDDATVVITTTYPLTFIAERIGGDRISLTQLVKPGVEAHDFEPAPSDVRAISESDLFIYNHPAFESWALNAAAAASGDNENSTVAVWTVNLEGEGEGHGGQEHERSTLDAHVWLNPLKAQEQADRILSALTEVDPDGSQIFTRNADALDIELRALDELIAAQLTNCDLYDVVVSHLAFGHMAERYGFNQIGLAGLSPEFESGPSQIATVIEKIDELGINHILQEPIVSVRLAETVSAETGAQLLVLHPLEVRTGDEASQDLSYIDIMKKNADALGTAMACAG